MATSTAIPSGAQRLARRAPGAPQGGPGRARAGLHGTALPALRPGRALHAHQGLLLGRALLLAQQHGHGQAGRAGLQASLHVLRLCYDVARAQLLWPEGEVVAGWERI